MWKGGSFKGCCAIDDPLTIMHSVPEERRVGRAIGTEYAIDLIWEEAVTQAADIYVASKTCISST